MLSGTVAIQRVQSQSPVSVELGELLCSPKDREPLDELPTNWDTKQPSGLGKTETCRRQAICCKLYIHPYTL